MGEIEEATKAAMDKGKKHAKKAKKKVMDRLHRGPSQPSSSTTNGDSKHTSIIRSMKQCHSAAKQTVELCTSTLSTGNNLVSCSNEINQSLIGAASDISAESFAVIADLIRGDKTKEARDLAITMKGQSTQCISLSMQMVDSLEKSVEALPDIVVNYVEEKARRSVTGELTAEDWGSAIDIDKDEEELICCIDAIEHLKLLTAIEAGKRSFKAIQLKSRLCHSIFGIIKKYAEDILSITEAVSDRDASTVVSKVKDGSIVRSILKAIGLSKYIKQFAEGCKRLMDKIVELFKGTAGKLSTLWGALSHAKDVMVRSLTEVGNARSLCDEAGRNAEKLKSMTTSLRNIEALKLVNKSHNNGSTAHRSMDDAAGTARDIDDEISDAVLKMKRAAKMVGDEYRSLPSIITDGITDDGEVYDTSVVGIGAKIRDIGNDIRELETASKSIEESNVIHAAMSIHREMSNVPRHVDTCQDMIESCTAFADQSKSSIDSFLGKWTLETAVTNVKEMCRLVSFAKLMEDLADQIHRLIRAITTLLRVMSAKIGTVADQVQSSGLNSVVSSGLNSIAGKVFGK